MTKVVRNFVMGALIGLAGCTSPFVPVGDTGPMGHDTDAGIDGGHERRVVVTGSLGPLGVGGGTGRLRLVDTSLQERTFRCNSERLCVAGGLRP